MTKRFTYELKYMDVTHKWIDDTKTTVELIYYNEVGVSTVLAYVHSDDAIEEAKLNRESYIDLMLETIKTNIQ